MALEDGVGVFDMAGFWKKLKAYGQPKGGGCSEDLRISTPEEEAAGMRCGEKRNQLTMERGGGCPLMLFEAWVSLWTPCVQI